MQLLRPRTLVLIYLQAILVYCYGNQVLSAWQLTLIALAVATWYAHAVAVNDLSDIEVDKINFKDKMTTDRPLLNGSVSEKGLRYISYALAAIFILLCMITHWHLIIVGTVMIGFNYIYSMPPVRLSSRGIIAQLLLPLGYIVFPATCLFIASGTVTVLEMMLVSAMYLLFIGRLLLKDFRDEKGDKQTGKRTFLVRNGARTTIVLAIVCMVLGIMGSVYVAQVYQLYLGVIAGACSVGVIVIMCKCYMAKRLSTRLIYIAMAGRVTSAWVFVYTLVLLCDVYVLSNMQIVLLLCMAIAMFGASLAWFGEELKKTVAK